MSSCWPHSHGHAVVCWALTYALGNNVGDEHCFVLQSLASHRCCLSVCCLHLCNMGNRHGLRPTRRSNG